MGRALRCLRVGNSVTSHSRPLQNGDPTITLSCLQTLRVRRLSPYSHAHTTIDPLILPQLQTLEIDASVLVGWNQHWHDHNFSELLPRSRRTLHHLSIRDVDFPNHELVRCLGLSPELTSFHPLFVIAKHKWYHP
ncbi:hypothetical protein J3R83DRAFT_80 [Lanmaoa asiatica]|nr:hypothetical protein J3R83DRAFT_80 [Lanmaoa asiatica]